MSDTKHDELSLNDEHKEEKAELLRSREAKPGYRTEIDGLRCIAVLAVIFYHSGMGFFRGGFVGVDIFFVISGYLMTTLIMNETSSGHLRLFLFHFGDSEKYLSWSRLLF